MSDNDLCKSCPMWMILCGPFLPETDLARANKRAVKDEEENHALKELMISKGIDAGGSIYVGRKEG